MKKENGKSKERLKEKGGPVVDPAAAQQLNMMVLKRYDSDIEEVLANSAHVTLYTLNVDTRTWSRKQVEGSLFLLRRKTAPRHQLMVLNKLSTDNYVETIHDGLDFEVHAPYLMYTHGNDEVVGVWFYEKQDLDKVSALLSTIKAEGSQPQVDATLPVVQQPQGPQAPQQPTAIAKPQEENSGNLQELLFRAHQRHQQQQHTHQPAPQPKPAPSPLPAPQPQPNPLVQLITQAAAQQAPSPASASSAPVPSAAPPTTAVPQPSAGEKKPMLISPAFFQAGKAGAQAEAVPPTIPSPSAVVTPTGCDQPSQDGNVLQKLFAKAMTVKSDDQRSPQGPAPPLLTVASTPTPVPQPAPAPATPGPATVQRAVAAPDNAPRDKIRQVFSRLLQNDAFVDMLASEFRAAGLLA